MSANLVLFKAHLSPNYNKPVRLAQIPWQDTFMGRIQGVLYSNITPKFGQPGLSIKTSVSHHNFDQDYFVITFLIDYPSIGYSSMRAKKGKMFRSISYCPKHPNNMNYVHVYITPFHALC